MSLKKKIADIRHTLAFRLTVWYAGIFMLSLFLNPPPEDDDKEAEDAS